MKPRVVIMSDYPPDFISFSGGVETATAGLLEGLREHQGEFEFHVISVAKELAQDQHLQRDGFYLHFLSLSQPWMRPRLPYRVARIIRELKRISPDLVHCQGTTDTALAAIWTGSLRLITIHGIRRQEANKRIGWERWSARADALIEPYIHRHFQDFICISGYAQQVAGIRKRTYLIPNAVRAVFFDVQRATSPQQMRLLFAGLLSPLKRPMDLIQAHRVLRKQFPSLETIFCGEPENQHYARMLWAQASDGIEFIGHLDRDGLIRELSRATALVLPSAQENAPLVVAEAMAAGVPVVATTVGGIPEMLKNGTAGALYEVGDIEKLTTILRGVLADPVCRMNLARAARSEAQSHYAPNQVACQTVRVYRQMLSDMGKWGKGESEG